MVSDTVREQLEAIETLLPVSFDIEETEDGDIAFDMHAPHGLIVKQDSRR